MQESTIVHLAITPHVARPGQIVTMKITYSGSGHCREEAGSTCGPQGAQEISLARVDCSTHRPIPFPTIAQLDDTIQCFQVTPGSAVGAPYYGIIQAPVGNCGATNGAFDCISADYILIEPPCNGQAADIAGANTTMSLGAADAQAASAQGAAPRGSCPLTVSIKVLGSSRSGLGVFPHFAHEGSKAFFIPPDSRKCASGCTNVLVTVTDPKTRHAVANATVNASASEIHGVAGDGYLCNQPPVVFSEHCGSHLLHLTTDKEGQVHLLYWAPGLIKETTTTINATAKKNCTRKSCSAGVREGSALPKTLTVKPYLIYEHTGTLTEKQAEELAGWAGGMSLVSKFGNLVEELKATHSSLTFALNTLVAAEIAAERAEKFLAVVEKAEPIVGVLEFVQLGADLYERQGFIATFLDSLDLSAIGLGDDPFERFVRAVPGTTFGSALANLGTIAPFHVGADGLLWKYSTALAFLAENHDPAFGAQSIHLDVYEVSHCKRGAHCGPGYRDFSDGIQPELYFVFDAEHSPTEHSFGPYTFTIPYDPNGWTESQHGLKGVL